MQLNLVTSYSAATLGVSAVGEGMALVVAGGIARMIYSEAELNAALSLSLGAVGAPGSGYVTSQSLAAPAPTDALDPGHSIAFQDSGGIVRAFMFDAHAGALTASVLDAGGMPGVAKTVSTDIGALTGVETFAIMGGATGNLAVLSTWNTPGLELFHLGSTGALAHIDAIADTAKSYVAKVSDTASVTLGGQNYLLTLSSLDTGITCYAVDGAGVATLNDSLGTHDGLAVSGPAALQVMQVAGTTYAVIASTGSSSLSVVRVNDMGCLFQTDHVVDDLTTRFAHPEVLDSFTMNGRSFVVSAGTDAGITVMELLPDGRLSPFCTTAFETGAGLYDVTGLQVAVNGTSVNILAVDDHADRVQEFTLSLAGLGGMIQARYATTTGSAGGDLILGTAANETLLGQGGDDWIHSGGGTDVMTGGAGADVFVWDAASMHGRITDFELHNDRIDISDWGHVYTLSALSIKSTANGAIIGLNGHDVTVVSATGHALTAADFVDGDFLF